MHRSMPALLVLAALVLAGCTAAPGPSGDPSPPPTAPAQDAMRIQGLVQTTAFVPVADALVELRGPGGNTSVDQTRSGADGTFAFAGLAMQVHHLHVQAEGHLDQSLRVLPDTLVTVDVQLRPAEADRPYHDTVRYRGDLQCAMEALIYSGSCDGLVQYAGEQAGQGAPQVFEDHSAFEHEVQGPWRTVVVDVVFDPDDEPALEGLRVTVQGLGDDAALGEYEQYGRFHGQDAFTFRLEPGGEYPDGDRPVPDQPGGFRFLVYPHGHLYHEVCDPDEATCFLGAGAGADVAFDLLVTTFHVEPAPDGWSLLEA